jgi:hypothetical protein
MNSNTIFVFLLTIHYNRIKERINIPYKLIINIYLILHNLCSAHCEWLLFGASPKDLGEFFKSQLFCYFWKLAANQAFLWFRTAAARQVDFIS